MGKFKHFILTKFNIGLYDNVYNIDTDPEEWMERRAWLFENFTYRSVKHQTCRDFTWVIAFDERTDYSIIRKYDYCDNIQVCYEQPHEWLRKQIPDADWILTSRIDNDDFYSRDFVRVLHDNVVYHREVIDVEYRQHVRGVPMLKYDPLRPRPNSPFLSVCEPWEDDILTAFGRPHTKMVDELPGRRIKRVLAWMVIHGDNVNNHNTLHEEGRLR